MLNYWIWRRRVSHRSRAKAVVYWIASVISMEAEAGGWGGGSVISTSVESWLVILYVREQPWALTNLMRRAVSSRPASCEVSSPMSFIYWVTTYLTIFIPPPSPRSVRKNLIPALGVLKFRKILSNLELQLDRVRMGNLFSFDCVDTNTGSGPWWSGINQISKRRAECYGRISLSSWTHDLSALFVQ